jgi:hypothetical protein
VVHHITGFMLSVRLCGQGAVALRFRCSAWFERMSWTT